MNFVQPIRDRDLLEDILVYLKERRNIRDYIIVFFGVNIGLRISDILKLKVRDVRKKTHIYLRATKTGKEIKLPIEPYVQKELNRFIAGRNDNDYLFVGRQKKRKTGLSNQPLDRSTVYKMLNIVAKKFGLDEQIGCHTMRKTFGYHFYLATKNIALLMEIFGHSSQTITLRYIGFTQDSIDQAMKKFNREFNKNRR